MNRRALTLRTLSIAALAVMILAPEAVVHPSFQMSFAATLALVAVYEGGLPLLVPRRESAWAARIALWGGREIAALLVASLVAGAATSLYAAYHFHRIAPYGVLANLLAMPVVSAFVMPTGIAALIALPFGFDGPLWRAMGAGIEWMTAIATWITALPGAVGRVPAFGPGPLLIGTLGLVVVALLRTPLRWSGAAMIALAGLLAAGAPRPDVLIAARGDTVAVRGVDGRLAIARLGGASGFSDRDWLAADGDARAAQRRSGTGRVPEAGAAAGFACDAAACVARLADGRAVSLVRTAEAFAEDCVRAAVIVTLREPPSRCAARVIDRSTLEERGALALRRDGEGWEITAARPTGTDRPWARAARDPSLDAVRASPASSGTPSGRGASPAIRDATPAPDTLGQDD